MTEFPKSPSEEFFKVFDDYDWDSSCQGTVPPALLCFFESTDYEDAIRNAISIGGDSDTIAAITGAITGAYYGVPAELKEQAKNTFLRIC